MKMSGIVRRHIKRKVAAALLAVMLVDQLPVTVYAGVYEAGAGYAEAVEEAGEIQADPAETRTGGDGIAEEAAEDQTGAEGDIETVGETKLTGVSYIDETGKPATTPEGVSVTVLEGGNEATLAGGWYVVNSDVTYNGKVNCTGDCHIILADTGKLNIGSSNGQGIIGGSCSLTIYGQSGGAES